uniref:Uncharacterized protein n=1 Tax=Rhodosorus marinus TaxID=101924 RepID=A0A7S3A5N4_9RHOD|mmetsp:Transcript_45705/g.177952  ORF Transcript_45705/g.177952 Transcript_45705/m.177952 type:complete len:338 (+) Transcript_45705:1238-2251(+)
MSCFCGLMESEPATGSYDRAQMDAQKMATQHNSRANHSDVTPPSRKHDEKVALSNDGKLVISTAPVEGKDKTVLSETWVEMKALDKRIAQNWLRYTGPADYTTIIEILVDRAKLLELVNKYGNDGGNLRDPAMEKLLQRADVTNTKLAAVTETLEAEIDGLQRRELELKKMWALVKQSDDNQGIDLMRNELGELIIEVKMYKSRWENALDTRLKQKLRQVEIAVEIINEETKGANEDGTFPSSGVMLKQVSSPSFRATRRSITRVLSLRTEEDQEDPNSSFRLASKRINTLELLAGMVEPGGTERFQSAVLADQGRKSSQPGKFIPHAHWRYLGSQF